MSTLYFWAQVHPVSIPTLQQGETWIRKSFLCSGFHSKETWVRSTKRYYGLLRNAPDVCDQISTAPGSKPQKLCWHFLSVSYQYEFTRFYLSWLSCHRSQRVYSQLYAFMCSDSRLVLQGPRKLNCWCLFKLWWCHEAFYHWFKCTKHSEISPSLRGPFMQYTQIIHNKISQSQQVIILDNSENASEIIIIIW